MYTLPMVEVTQDLSFCKCVWISCKRILRLIFWGCDLRQVRIRGQKQSIFFWFLIDYFKTVLQGAILLNEGVVDFGGFCWNNIWIRGQKVSNFLILCQISNGNQNSRLIKVERCVHICPNCSEFDLCGHIDFLFY